MPIPQDITNILTEQQTRSASFLATIEPVSGADDKLKVTPVSASGCGCDRAMIISRTHIASIAVDGDKWTSCCGKQLRVCRITLEQQASVLVTDLMSAAKPAAHTITPERISVGSIECWHQELACINRGVPYGLCHEWYLDCIGADDSAAPASSGAVRRAARRPSGPPAGWEWCECVNEYLPRQVCWKVCGAHG